MQLAARTSTSVKACWQGCGRTSITAAVPNHALKPHPVLNPPPPRPTPPHPTCSDRLTELRRLIMEEQQNAKAPDNLYPAAFVTFKRRTSQASGAPCAGDGGPHGHSTRHKLDFLSVITVTSPHTPHSTHSRFTLSQVVASRTLLSEDMSTWRCQAAPRAEELIWKNLGWRIWERSGERPRPAWGGVCAAGVGAREMFMGPAAHAGRVGFQSDPCQGTSRPSCRGRPS